MTNVGVLASQGEEDIGALPVYARRGVRTESGVDWRNEHFPYNPVFNTGHRNDGFGSDFGIRCTANPCCDTASVPDYRAGVGKTFGGSIPAERRALSRERPVGDTARGRHNLADTGGYNPDWPDRRMAKRRSNVAPR